MPYIGPNPAESFTSFATQEFSTSATTSYTLDHAVANENEIALFVNNVRQQPGSGKAYTATGTALTLSAATASTDTMYCVFLGRALQTVTPATNSITAAMVSNDLISGKDALTDAPASTDELLISDGGTLKRIDVSLVGGDNLPIFAVSKSGGSNQTINHGSSTKVTFSHEITDPSSAFASDKFTVPSGKDGTYLFAWNLQIEDSDSAIQRMSTNLYKNGSVISSGQMRSEGGDTVFANFTLTQTRIVPASAGDYFEVYIYQESSNGSSVILEASTSHNQFFSGTKLIT